MTILGYIIVGFVCFFAGVTITCILLAPKTLEVYSKYSHKTEDSLKSNIAIAKGAYKAYLKESEGSGESESEDCENEELGSELTEEGDTEDEN